MNHPSPDDWMSFVYRDALPPKRRGELRDHLRSCASCREQVARWRHAAARLDDWPLPPRTAGTRASWLAPIRLAAAAACLLLLGVGVGHRWTSSPVDLDRLRTELLAEVRTQVRGELQAALRADLSTVIQQAELAGRDASQRLLAAYATAQEQQRREDFGRVYGLLEQLDVKRATEVVGLQRDLRTMALLTDAGFHQTREQLVRLASSPSPPDTTTLP